MICVIWVKEKISSMQHIVVDKRFSAVGELRVRSGGQGKGQRTTFDPNLLLFGHWGSHISELWLNLPYLTWLSAEYIPAAPCQPAGVWTQQPGCHPFQRTWWWENRRVRGRLVQPVCQRFQPCVWEALQLMGNDRCVCITCGKTFSLCQPRLGLAVCDYKKKNFW